MIFNYLFDLLTNLTGSISSSFEADFYLIVGGSISLGIIALIIRFISKIKSFAFLGG